MILIEQEREKQINNNVSLCVYHFLHIYIYIYKRVQGHARSLDIETDDADNNDNAGSQESHYKRANLPDTALTKQEKYRSILSITDIQKNKAIIFNKKSNTHIHMIYSSMFDDIYKSII
jgi:hypothetical protein